MPAWFGQYLKENRQHSLRLLRRAFVHHLINIEAFYSDFLSRSLFTEHIHSFNNLTFSFSDRSTISERVEQWVNFSTRVTYSAQLQPRVFQRIVVSGGVNTHLHSPIDQSYFSRSMWLLISYPPNNHHGRTNVFAVTFTNLYIFEGTFKPNKLCFNTVSDNAVPLYIPW